MTYLTLSNVSKQFGDTYAVNDFNLDVEKGEFVSFLGPSGCGKTTTLRMVAGFETPTNGTIKLDGRDITEKAPNQRNMGMIFQSYALFPNMTVTQNIGFGLRVRNLSAAEIKERVDEMVSLVNLEKHVNKYPFQLSGGQQQRVSLARALAIRPNVLLLDEPLSALDAKIRVSLRAQIREIQKKLGITAIFVTHDQEEALSISDRIVVMYDGNVEQVGTPFEIYNFPRTHFVATFVGSLNTVSAEVLDPSQGLLNMDGVQFYTAASMKDVIVLTTRVTHAGQQLVSTGQVNDLKKGDKVLIAVRPERFSFASEVKKANIVDCLIENITFLGSVVRVHILIGNSRFTMDTFNYPSLELPRIGAKEQVTCSKEAVLILGVVER